MRGRNPCRGWNRGAGADWSLGEAGGRDFREILRAGITSGGKRRYVTVVCVLCCQCQEKARQNTAWKWRAVSESKGPSASLKKAAARFHQDQRELSMPVRGEIKRGGSHTGENRLVMKVGVTWILRGGEGVGCWGGVCGRVGHSLP